MKKKLFLKVYGRVQGVFFRDSARRKAEELGLICSAENKPDKTVEIIAEGREEDLKQLIEWCRAGGPEYAEVRKVKSVLY
ncbi:MAG: acylphosphatase [Candidatus Tagabacteria bacterium CG09_land_8_20_14_0_10_41_14]|uniref:acylphosphatase n=2 Tax=Candidatus Tagaibacteriota TaxID=1817918 RepID=A0A2H0WLX6_9BACT|nr:MAG: acylphosphatase [Candidatus Tagabacteria bacterium CG09_land_8_20_14_0_10_41_14]PJE72916.1 MAG: acylphosphatase [Candidatus Tagabacteria bacterium CG10_big_fil_rev_8_21_14_0_10_40_13]